MHNGERKPHGTGYCISSASSSSIVYNKYNNITGFVSHQHHHHRTSITNTTTSPGTTRATIPTNNTDFKRSRINFLSNLDKVYWPKTSEHQELTKADLMSTITSLVTIYLPILKIGLYH